MRDAAGNVFALGARKTASARVWLKEGDGAFTVNSLPLHSYFPRVWHRTVAMEALSITETLGAVDVGVSVRGGGKSGQAGAVRHGVAKALLAWKSGLLPILAACECVLCSVTTPFFLPSPLLSLTNTHTLVTAAGLLMRDPRMKERKKPGQKGARAKFQWVRR